MKRLEGKPFVILGINSDVDREKLRKIIQDEKITWRSWWDDGSTKGPIATRWNVHGWPTLYLLDAKGVIRYKGDRLRSISLEKAVNGNWRQVTGLDKAVDELMKEMEKGR